MSRKLSLLNNGLMPTRTAVVADQKPFGAQLLQTLCDQRATEDAAKLFDVCLCRLEAPTSAKYFAQPFEAPVHRASCGRKFGLSSRNHILMVSNATIRGDLVCILGGHTPFISRKSGDKFNLLGACYTHGIMSGELMHELRIGKYEL